MANDTRPSQKIKDSENNSTKGRQINGSGSTSSHAASPDPCGLRRSTRETSSKHRTTPSSSSAKKSEFVEKQNPTTSPVRKSERIEKQKNSSPLRRPGRGKNISDLSNVKRMTEKKEKKEKSVKQLTLETEDVDENENPDEEPVEVNKTQMDARHYKELFRKQKQKANTTDHCEEPKNQGDSGSKQVDHGIKFIERNGKDLVEDFTEKSVIREPKSNIKQSPRKTLEDSDGHELSSTSLKHCDTWESPKKNLEDSDGHELPMTGPKHGPMEEACKSLDGDGLHLLKNVVAKETMEDAGKVALENIQFPTSADSTLKGRILDRDTSLEMGHMLSKRKRDTADIVSDPPLMVGSKDMCNSMADAVTLLPSNCKSKDYVEICDTCFKKQRMEVDPSVQENCSCNTKSNCLFDSAAEERLAKDIANGSKSESSRFIEYWLPVQISSVQLEQYCATLLENSLSLCSPLRSDPIGALRKTLISTRKCCDHPYLVDQSLQMLLTKDLKPIEYLDVGIKSSGKLQLLETMLLEMKKLGLRAVILFQSIGGSGRDAIGDILDDFLRQRFGQDSFERIDSGLVYSKKQSALNKFNKENDRFVFLLETRACQPSIKLSSVDIVIMFNSDWNPMNDLKALQRIALGSKFEQIMIFRLYSSLTVEEKFLILAKQGKTFDGNAPSINPSTIQRLLMWGASHIFNKLNEFHDATPAFDTTIVFDQSHLEDLLQEFLIILAPNREDYDSRKLSLILHAKPQVTYRTDLPLFGEQKIQVMNEDQPCMFWTTLLNGKHPPWKYSSSSSQRNRKRTSVHHFDDIQKKHEAGSGEVVKKRKKVGSDFVDSPSLKSGSDRQIADQDTEGISGTLAPNLSHSWGRSTGLVNDQIYVQHASSSPHQSTSHFSKIPKVNTSECEERRKLHDSQKSFHTLLKPDMAKLSEVLHLPDNVRAMVESFLEYIMNYHHVTRELAALLQAFQISLCWTAAALLNHKINHKKSLELVNKSINFGCKKEEADYVYSLLRCLKRTFLYRTGKMKVPNPPKASDLSTKCSGTEQCSAASDHQGVKGLDGSLKVSESSEKQSLSQSELALEYQLALSDLLKSLKEIQRKCDKMMKNLLQKQREEKENFDRTYEKEMVQLETRRELEAAVIRLHSPETTRFEKLKKLDDEYVIKIDELKKQMAIRLKSLEVEQEESRNKVHQWKAWWVEAVKSWARNELGFTECERAISPGHEQEHVVPKVPISKEQILVGVMADGELGQDIPASLSDCLDNALSVKQLPQDQICDRSVLNVPDANRVPETVFSGDGREKIESAKLCSFGEQVPDGITLRKANNKVPLGASEAVRETEVHKNIVFVTSPLSKGLNHDGATSNVPCGEASPTTPEIVSSDGRQNILPSNLPSLNEKISDVSDSCITEEVPLAETETAPSEVAEGDNRSMRHLLSLPDGDSLASTPEILNSSDTLHKVVPDIAASCIPIGKVPSSKPPFAPRQVHENDDANGENHGVGDKLLIRNSLREDEVSTPEVAASCMSDRDGPLSDPESANREVPKGGNADRENNVAFREVSTPEVPDGEDPASTSMIVNSSDRVASCNPNGKDPSSESPFTPREAHESDDGNGKNDVVGDNLHIRNSLSMPGREDEISIPEVAASCMSDKDFALSDPESANREVPEGGNAERENNAAIGVDQQDGMVCSVNQEPQFLEAPVVDSSQAQHVLALAQGGPLLSNQVEPERCTVPSTDSEMQARDAANIQTQSSSRVVEPSPLHSGLDLTPSQYGVGAHIAEVGAQVQPSSSRGSPSNLNNQLDLPLAGGVELQPSNDDHLSHASRHVSDTRTVSTNLPVQTAPTVSSHMPFSSHDPLQNEMERIVKEAEQTIKIHEEMKLQLKSDCNKEIEEAIAQIRKKYEIKLQEAEACFLLKKKELDVNHNKVLMNKILAEAFRLKIIDNNFTGMLQETGTNFMQQLAQLSPQQMPQRPSSVPGGTPPASLPATISTVLSVQTASPPVVTPQAISPSLQAVNTPSAIFSGTPPRPPPHISSITPSLGNLQVGSEIRAPAPHLHPFRPSTSMHPSVVPPLSCGMPVQPGHGNAFTPRIAPTVSQAGRAHIPATSVGLPVLPNNLSRLDLLINAANQSMANPNPPNTLPLDTSSNCATPLQPLPTMPRTQSNAPQPSAATDIVCLSDDD
ncbi:hypothetical protein SLEP1_g13811 [Rubroshorea leprosula]|uniref:Helicase C-terminal domain-containing protein n=1 Tax=Rubroshorea leprosula TaxID=152421 RepID=A0AAV5IQY3_9ROSI|nr:hypothetical protein SLEP1_g13811 [Rubroshorea leprosula]